MNSFLLLLSIAPVMGGGVITSCLFNDTACVTPYPGPCVTADIGVCQAGEGVYAMINCSGNTWTATTYGNAMCTGSPLQPPITGTSGVCYVSKIGGQIINCSVSPTNSPTNTPTHTPTHIPTNTPTDTSATNGVAGISTTVLLLAVLAIISSR